MCVFSTELAIFEKYNAISRNGDHLITQYTNENALLMRISKPQWV